MIGQVGHGRIVQYLVLDVLPDRIERILIHVLQSLENVCQQCERSRVEGTLTQSLGKICLSGNVELSFTRSADHT